MVVASYGCAIYSIVFCLICLATIVSLAFVYCFSLSFIDIVIVYYLICGGCGGWVTNQMYNSRSLIYLFFQGMRVI